MSGGECENKSLSELSFSDFSEEAVGALGVSCPLVSVQLWAACPLSIPVSSGYVPGNSQRMGMLEEDSSHVVP